MRHHRTGVGQGLYGIARGEDGPVHARIAALPAKAVRREQRVSGIAGCRVINYPEKSSDIRRCQVTTLP